MGTYREQLPYMVRDSPALPLYGHGIPHRSWNTIPWQGNIIFFKHLSYSDSLPVHQIWLNNLYIRSNQWHLKSNNTGKWFREPQKYLLYLENIKKIYTLEILSGSWHTPLQMASCPHWCFISHSFQDIKLLGAFKWMIELTKWRDYPR